MAVRVLSAPNVTPCVMVRCRTRSCWAACLSLSKPHDSFTRVAHYSTMGEFADDVVVRLKNRLERETTSHDWQTEYRISGTPVDLAGISTDSHVLIELEWRRADPADNTAKIFRHLCDSSSVTDSITVFQLFTNYYDLASTGVSSKRKNAEFVGSVASESLNKLKYVPIGFEIEPPKAGERRPPKWEETTDSVATEISNIINRSASQLG